MKTFLKVIPKQGVIMVCMGGYIRTKIAQKLFRQVWGNSGKNLSQPQKSACSYTYCSNSRVYLVEWRKLYYCCYAEGHRFHRRSQGGSGVHVSPQIFSIPGHSVLWEVISLSYYCCSPEIKHFGPPQNFYSPKFWGGCAIGRFDSLFSWLGATQHCGCNKWRPTCRWLESPVEGRFELVKGEGNVAWWFATYNVVFVAAMVECA